MTHLSDSTAGWRIDVNCDIGETSLPWHASPEPELLALISSANVACGGHAGDAESMRAVCTAAVSRGVAIGAQVSYPDRENFGRVAMEIDTDLLSASIAEQYAALVDAATSCGGVVSYVKPHGALYNVAVAREDHARVVVELAHQHGVALFVLVGSATDRCAQTDGVPIVREWFADRNYLANGQLVPRSHTQALAMSPREVYERVARAVRDGVVQTIDGAELHVAVQTICVHSDTPGAADLLRAVRSALTEVGVRIGNC
ncbi:MAG: 5-oxoprolinase subunit PxpA [Actinomycetota bacterium]